MKDAEANEIIFTLDRNGIKAEKRTTKEGITLSVDEANVPHATEMLNAAGLPRRNLSSLDQMFKKKGMISAPLEERTTFTARRPKLNTSCSNSTASYRPGCMWCCRNDPERDENGHPGRGSEATAASALRLHT